MDQLLKITYFHFCALSLGLLWWFQGGVVSAQSFPDESEFLMPTVVPVSQDPSVDPFLMPYVVPPEAVFNSEPIADSQVMSATIDAGQKAGEEEADALNLTGFQDPAPLVPFQPLSPLNSTDATPRRIIGPSLANLRRSRAAQIRAPNMIGDTTDGACGAVRFFGNITGGLEHPSFNCTRLNVAESNSPIPHDRIYFRYNHFQNITTISVFPGSFEKGTNDLNVDRFTFGGEKTFFDGLVSLEARIPFSRELTSNILMENIQGETNFPIDDLATEFGNVSFIAKMLVKNTETTAVSFGLGLNVPTADDVDVNIRVDNDQFPVIFPGGIPIAFLDVNGDGHIYVKNQIFNLSPFVAAVWAPTSRWFTQGFLQVDMPLNEANVSVYGPLDINGRSVVVDEKSKFIQQDLIRLNVGSGYWLVDRPNAEHLTGIAFTTELHFTSTLEDARLGKVNVPLPIFPVGPPYPAELSLGNTANRVDVLNLTMGGIIELWDQTTLAHGFVVPLRTQGASKPFDFEYTFQLNHRF